MGDPPNPNSIPPYDPYDSPINYEYFRIGNDPNPTLTNLSDTNDPNASFNPFGNPYYSHDVNNQPTGWEHNYNYNVDTTATQQAGPSSSSRQPLPLHETQPLLVWPQEPMQQPGPSSSSHQPTSLDETRPLLVWPPEPVPYQCSCCQVLREFIHTDVTGRCATKLEIHGRLGLICHAILEIKDRVSMVPSPSEFHMIDFCKKSIDNVKEYLQEYCNDRRMAGLIMVQDPLSMFYEALCVGIQWQQNEDQVIVPEQQMVVAQAEAEERVARTNLSQQRERAARLTLENLQEHFHLTIEQAAREMNLCPTVLKKACRKYGFPRWPHRRIKSLRRRISNLRNILSSSTAAEERARLEADIQRLEEELANVMAGVNIVDETD
ncbi:RWP-RK domain-containing protein [Euphorbia peplus]|nr:RWP-RK domain-containing protein [Euphorbia peplus]